MIATDAILAALRKRYRFSEGEVPHDAAEMVYEAGKDREELLYSLLFVPEFSIVDDSVLLSYADIDTERRFREAKKAGRMSLARLEATFNHVEVEFLFAKGTSIPTKNVCWWRGSQRHGVAHWQYSVLTATGRSHSSTGGLRGQHRCRVL